MWALPNQYEQLKPPKLLKQLTRLNRAKRFASAEVVSLLRQWLDAASGRNPDGLFALECLGWAHALPRISPMVSETDWRTLLARLEETVEVAGGLAPHDDPVVHQLLCGELPLTLAYLLPEITRFKALRRTARAALSFGIVELTDGEGLVNARLLDHYRQLLAIWTRCSLLGATTDWDCFDAGGRNQYEWVVRQSLRLSRPDGSLVFARGVSGDWCPDLSQIALAEGGDQLDIKIADHMLPGATSKLSARQTRKLPEPSVYSEWSEACFMRSKWSRKSPQFSCLFSDRRIRSELCVGGRVIWSGDTSPELQIDRSVLAMTSDWTEVCWFTDDDVDYLELEAAYEGGWRVQRQLLLARHDHFLLQADAVLGPAEADISYACRFPLAEDIAFLGEEATCEGYLKNSRPLCTVLPIALPEWRRAATNGSLQLDSQQLCLSMQASARRLYAPLFVDLLSRRWLEKRTWRQLTVAEQLEIQGPDIAAGFRVQLGRKQWLIYRSLAPRSNRTLLGQNLSQEFVTARFDDEGCLQELIEIE